MSLVIKYFKRKLKPFKACVDDRRQSISFEKDECCSSKTIDKVTKKPKKNEKKFKFLIKNNKKLLQNNNGDDVLFKSPTKGVNVKMAKHKATISETAIPLEEDEEEFEKRMYQKSTQELIFNTPISSNTHTFDKQETSSNPLNNSNHFVLSNGSATTTRADTNLNSMSCLLYSAPLSCSSHENTCFMSGSIINSTPANSFTSSMVTYNTKYANNNNSNESDDDGLMSNISISNSNEGMQQQSTPFGTLTTSTEGLAKIKSLKTSENKFETLATKIKQSNTTDFNLLISQANKIVNENDTNQNDLLNNKKCRRSNTTFTVAGSTEKSNFKIIDYFTKLELNKPVKKQAIIRKLKEDRADKSHNSSKLKTNLNDSISQQDNNNSLARRNRNEIEKIQDVLFYDEPSMTTNASKTTDNSQDISDTDLSLNNNAGSQNELIIESPLIATSALLFREAKRNSCRDFNICNKMNSILSKSSPNKLSLIGNENEASCSGSATSPHESSKAIASKLNETHVVNLSMEKIRRSLSYPILVQNNSGLLANVSKISMVKDSEEEENTIAATQNSNKTFNKESTQSEIYKTVEDDSATKTLTNQNDDLVEFKSVSIDATKDVNPFVRQEPHTRVSKNIKEMFQNVINQQLNALSTLEKFYEEQVSKFEIERQRNISLNPQNKEKINEFFDAQIKVLETKAQSNLKFICEKKPKASKVEPSNNKNELRRKISQLMLIKQIELQQKNQIRTSRSTLQGLKSNLLNQNDLLPSKKHRSYQQSNDLFPITTANDEDFKDTLFKRNLSLPFQQCKQNPLVTLGNKPRTSSNKRCENSSQLASAAAAAILASTASIKFKTSSKASLAYNSSSRIRSHSRASTNENVINQLNHHQKGSSCMSAKNQYQKNTIKKISTSIENIYKQQQQHQQQFYTDVSLLNNTESNQIINNKFANVKRQNKSAGSLKSDQSVLSNNTSQLGNESSVLNFQTAFSSNFSNILSKSNSSLFSTSGFETNHLIKYQPPRYSDSNMQFKLNQQRMVINAESKKNISNNLVYVCNKPPHPFNASTNKASANSIHLIQNSNKLNFMIETEV